MLHRAATTAEFANMSELQQLWYLNGYGRTLAAKDGKVRSVMSGNSGSWLAGPSEGIWQYFDSTAILVRPQGRRGERTPEQRKLPMAQWPDYVDPKAPDFDPTPYLYHEDSDGPKAA